MAKYSIEEAKACLSELIDKAIAGENVTIVQEGKPAVQMTPAVVTAAKRPSADLLNAIAARAKTRAPLGESAVDIIRRLRDEREERILSAATAAARSPEPARHPRLPRSG